MSSESTWSEAAVLPSTKAAATPITSIALSAPR